MAKVNRVGRSFSTLPFDGIDSAANVFFHDDMLGAGEAAAAGEMSTLVGIYELDQVAGDSAVTAITVAGVDNHPGILRITTGGTTPADGDIAALSVGATTDPGVDGDINLDANGVYVATLIRIADVDAAKAEFGLIGQAPAAVNSSAADLVTFVWDPEDAANVGDQLFLAQVNSAGTDVEEAFSLPYVENDWVLLEIYATSSDAYFRMSTEDGSETINLTPAAMPLVSLTPAWAVEAVGAAEEQLDIDLFHMRYQRQPIVTNTDVAWLGA